MKNIIRLTENDLKNIITESVKNILRETKDRSQYWKERWAKQKEEGTIPDRSEYWKKRARKQKQERNRNKKKHVHIHNTDNYYDNLQRYLRDDAAAMDMMTDNEWGEYFGDHE